MALEDVERQIVDEQGLIHMFRRVDSATFDPEADQHAEKKALLCRWLEQQEGVATSLDEICGPITTVWLNLRRARLYLRMGFLEFALENYSDAAQCARQLGKDDLVRAIMRKYDRVNSRSR